MPLLDVGAGTAASVSGLRRMKAIATGLLLVAGVTYAVSQQLSGAWVGYLTAASEAAMVGGLADWFAVTALFRRPLGLPIPHTGLVPRKKDEIALKLGEFVTGHFLTRDVVLEQLHEAQLLQRTAAWLREPEVAERVAREVAFNASALLGSLDEEAVVASVVELVRRDVARRSYAPVLGKILERSTEGGGHRPLLDVVLSRGKSYLRAHREQLLPQLRQFVDDRGWLAALLVSDRRLRNVLMDLAALLDEMERNPRHRVRLWLEGLLGDIARALQHDRQVAARVDQAVLRLLEDPAAQAQLHELVTDAVVSVRESLGEVDGELQQRLAVLVLTVADRLVSDVAFRQRIERLAEAVVGHAVDNYGDELTSLIRTQVARWDATSASRRIELAVGRDLQFIRLNGTAVGALAGLAIHAATTVAS
jgi:uncharacterized membrane-anchored protein YjiN (DUF445 family)